MVHIDSAWFYLRVMVLESTGEKRISELHKGIEEKQKELSDALITAAHTEEKMMNATSRYAV